MDFKEVMQLIGFHSLVLLRGFGRVLYGAAVAGLIAIAAKGFAMVSLEGGYVAVCDFIVSILTMIVALTCTYAFGGKRKGGRY